LPTATAAQIRREVGAKSLHLGRVERGRGDGESVLTSTNQVAGARHRLEFRHDFVAEILSRDAVEVGVVVCARTRHVDPFECVDMLRRDLRNRTAHPVGADSQRRVKFVDARRILAANSDYRAIFDQQIDEPEAIAKRHVFETARRVDHRGIHQHAPEAQSAIVGAVAHEAGAVIEVRADRSHPLEAHAARALEHFKDAHALEHFGSAAKHDVGREPVGRK